MSDTSRTTPTRDMAPGLKAAYEWLIVEAERYAAEGYATPSTSPRGSALLAESNALARASHRIRDLYERALRHD
jgi:hypothetical protein